MAIVATKSEEILSKQEEKQDQPNGFCGGPSALAWIKRAHWAVSSESKIKPNGKKMVECYLLGG
jgi:hypothetical protein